MSENKQGRPKKVIDKQVFENACTHFCTRAEISSLFGCSHQTIRRWCKDTYGATFEEVSQRFQTVGKERLRTAGYLLAMKNPSVHIFYAKNYLGMTDTPQPIETGEKTAELSAAINAAARAMSQTDLSSLITIPHMEEIDNEHPKE